MRWIFSHWSMSLMLGIGLCLHLCLCSCLFFSHTQAPYLNKRLARADPTLPGLLEGTKETNKWHPSIRSHTKPTRHNLHTPNKKHRKKSHNSYATQKKNRAEDDLGKPKPGSLKGIGVVVSVLGFVQWYLGEKAFDVVGWISGGWCWGLRGESWEWWECV